MRKLNLSLWILIILLPLSGCTKDDKELLDFYLSQPKDPRLIGKWQSLIEPSMYQIYSEDGYIYNYSDGDINRTGSQGDCWYTEGDSVLRRYFYTGSRFTQSKEFPARYYKIEGDNLYLSDSNIFEVVPNYKRNTK